MKVGTAFIELEARMTKMESDLRKASSKMKTAAKKAESSWRKAGRRIGARMGGVFTGIAQKAKVAGVAMVGLLGFGGYKAVKVAADYESILKQIETRIKSSGGAARITKEEIQKLAKDMEQYTTFSEKEILQLSASLLTFHKITREEFPAVLMATLDTITGLRAGGKQASVAEQGIMIGKALGNPLRGLESLTDAGVVFSKQQKKNIKALADMGDVAGAQTEILKELNVEFGGGAHAAVGTFSGRVSQVGNAFESLMRRIGGPIVGDTGALVRIKEFLESEKAINIAEGLGAAFKGLAEFVSKESVWNTMWTIARDAAQAIANLTKPLQWLYQVGDFIGKHTGIQKAVSGEAIMQEYARKKYGQPGPAKEGPILYENNKATKDNTSQLSTLSDILNTMVRNGFPFMSPFRLG